MTRTERQRRGNDTEDKVLVLARERGLKLVERNFRTRLGELDLLLTDGETLIIVEVRFRKSSEYGLASESVTRNKQRRIIAATRGFIQRRKQWQTAPVRFDVVGADGAGNIDWIEHAFLAE